MRTIVETTDRYDIYHHTGMTKFSGCQCYKDCTCYEDFKSTNYNYYSVKKKFNKPKTTTHNTLEEAKERAAFLETIPITNNKKWKIYR